MKRVAIISPMSRIIIDNKSIRSLEAVYLKKHLDSENCKCYYVSKKIKEDDNDYINIFDLSSLNLFDEIYIHNFNTNFFGGVVSSLTIKTLQLLSSYNGRVFYYITDPKLKYQNLAKIILSRKKNIYESEISIEELQKIKSELSSIELRMNAIFTGYNYLPIYGLDFYNVTKVNIFKNIAKEVHYNTPLFQHEKMYDICYYGDNRGTYRNNKIKKYFDSNEIKSLTIGLNLELKQNDCLKKVDNNKLQDYVKHSLSSIVIGDKDHENSFITMRFYENINMNVVSFIDIDYDSSRLLFKNEVLKNFNYISSQGELINKINMLKKDKDFFNQIVELQKLELI